MTYEQNIALYGRGLQKFHRHGKILKKTVYEKRNAVIEDNVCKLPLGMSGEFAIIDVDKQYLEKYYWSKASTGYAQANIDGKTMLLHKIIIDKQGIVDHINRDKLDNRSENLRLCTPSQNAANSIRKIGNTGFRGVKYQTKNKKWCVRIAGKYGGSFLSAIEAAREYDRLAQERWGQYAITNSYGD